MKTADEWVGDTGNRLGRISLAASPIVLSSLVMAIQLDAKNEGLETAAKIIEREYPSTAQRIRALKCEPTGPT